MNCKKLLSLLLFTVICLSSVTGTSAAASREQENEEVVIAMDEIKPDTWTAVDGLGRTVSNYQDVGATRSNKVVGCFYWIWFELWKNYTPRNITQIISKNPEAQNDLEHPAWGEGTGPGTPYYWNEPLFGYYQNLDTYVIRKHAEMLADAGVDVIIFDCSNNSYTFPESYEILCQTFQMAKAEGVNVPQIAFLISFAAEKDSKIQLRQIYKNLYKPGRYKDLWFYWEGKPLIMGHYSHLSSSIEIEREISQFFTFRVNDPLFFREDFAYSSKVWSWCSAYPQAKYGVREDGTVEQISVSVAQNIRTNADGTEEMVAQNDPRGGLHGRGWAYGNYSYSYMKNGSLVTIDKNTKDAYLYSLNFQQQWDYALEVNPDFIFITGWNEWVAQRNAEWKGTVNAFSDNFTDEFSRDIEPSKGILKDHYYYQLVDNIRRFKGVSAPEIATADTHVNKTVDIFSHDDQWSDVTLSYNHYIRSTQDRDIDGAKGTHYENHTMRNDIVTSKVAYDKDNIYFMVETLEDLTASSDPAWMRLLIDTDTTGRTSNWESFEYIVNRVSPSGSEAVVEKSKGGWDWTRVGTASFCVSGKRLQIAIPRSLLGLENSSDLCFNFKWADNTREEGATDDSGDILDFYSYGDVAPGGRFMFSFMTSIPEKTDDSGDKASSGIPGYIWGILAGAATLAAVGTALVVKRIKKRKK